MHRSRCIKNGVRLTVRAAISGSDTIQFISELNEQTASRLLSFDGRAQDMGLCELFHILLADPPNPWKYEIAGGLIRIWLGTILGNNLDFGHRVQPMPSTENEFGNRGNALCERANTFIYGNFQRSLDIEEIAQHAGVTPRHLNRLFKKYMGTSVGHTLRDVRLSTAFGILSRNPQSSVKEIAYRVGFSSPSYFTQCYKQQYGMLPTEVHLRLAKPLKDT
jgi:AraC-like DNA-binding protein